MYIDSTYSRGLKISKRGLRYYLLRVSKKWFSIRFCHRTNCLCNRAASLTSLVGSRQIHQGHWSRVFIWACGCFIWPLCVGFLWRQRVANVGAESFTWCPADCFQLAGKERQIEHAKSYRLASLVLLLLVSTTTTTTKRLHSVVRIQTHKRVVIDQLLLQYLRRFNQALSVIHVVNGHLRLKQKDARFFPPKRRQGVYNHKGNQMLAITWSALVCRGGVWQPRA